MIIDNIRQIRYRVRAAAERAGRDPEAVGLVAVTKYANISQVRELLESGAVAEVGENRVQEAQKKKEALGSLAERVRWRLIGHLQTNKAKAAVETFDAVDSVDSLKVAEALSKAAGEKILPVLIQVKLSDKETQSGAAPEAVDELLQALARLRNLQVEGLMAIAPDIEPLEAVRPHFKKMRALFERHFAGKPGARLSMGMSRDYEIAVEEGATQIRVGTQIFSQVT